MKRRPLRLASLAQGKISLSEIFMRKEGVEPPRPFGHKILSLARLPVPPLPQWWIYSTSLRRAAPAGYFARELGNEEFARPEPLESFRLAACEHDNGWSECERAPRIDPVTFLPYSFMSLPTEEHIELYQRGIERVVKADRYAGLLVSLHCSGLYDR